MNEEKDNIGYSPESIYKLKTPKRIILPVQEKIFGLDTIKIVDTSYRINTIDNLLYLLNSKEPLINVVERNGLFLNDPDNNDLIENLMNVFPRVIHKLYKLKSPNKDDFSHIFETALKYLHSESICVKGTSNEQDKLNFVKYIKLIMFRYLVINRLTLINKDLLKFEVRITYSFYPFMINYDVFSFEKPLDYIFKERERRLNDNTRRYKGYY